MFTIVTTNYPIDHSNSVQPGHLHVQHASSKSPCSRRRHPDRPVWDLAVTTERTLITSADTPCAARTRPAVGVAKTHEIPLCAKWNRNKSETMRDRPDRAGILQRPSPPTPEARQDPSTCTISCTITIHHDPKLCTPNHTARMATLAGVAGGNRPGSFLPSDRCGPAYLGNQ
jgi:hypothetical protein